MQTLPQSPFKFRFITLFYFPNMLDTSIRNTKILQTIPPQNRYIFKPSYLKKLFLLSSISRIFCFITLVSVSDCFSRSFVAICIASIFFCNAFLTSWTVFFLNLIFPAPYLVRYSASIPVLAPQLFCSLCLF